MCDNETTELRRLLQETRAKIEVLKARLVQSLRFETRHGKKRVYIEAEWDAANKRRVWTACWFSKDGARWLCTDRRWRLNASGGSCIWIDINALFDALEAAGVHPESGG